MSRDRRILFSRTDRMGDVLLALPALEYLRQTLPGWGIDFQFNSGLHDLLRPYLKGLGVEICQGTPEWRRYQGALLLFAPAGELLQAWWGGVKVRGGIRSKPASWLWLNAGLSQRRSEGLRSEAIYNLEVARKFVTALGQTAPNWGEFRVCLPGDSGSEAAATAALREARVTEPFIVVHGGMGGSALNLGARGYASLVSRWPGATVALSAGPSVHDAPMVEALLREIPGAKKLPSVGLPVLREIFRRAELVVAPSTGPLHLAHYVGTDTVGIYPPVRAQRPSRWAPWGGAGTSRVLSPSHPCPGTRHCLGAKCDLHPCLDRMVGEALPSGWADGLMAPS
jgi:heptosyltransferase I